MERDQFHVETETVEEPATAEPAEHPALRIHFDGSHDRLRQELSERLRDDIAVEEIDVSFRHLSSDGESAEGILALSDRVTGRYVLEVKTAVNLVREFVQTVRESADQMSHDARYRVEIRAEGETVTTFEKDLLLVYDASGTLLRDASLIPTGIEL
jgi:hypothetical protein